MILTAKPTPHLRGSVNLPASKSYSIRAFMIAACGGHSMIDAPSDCDDAKVSIRVAKHLGAHVTHPQRNIWKIVAHKQRPNLTDINVGESGTVLRFLLPILALQDSLAQVKGEGTLKSRPNIHLVNTLKSMGADISGQGDKETIPLTVRKGKFHGGTFFIDGSLSSQFISALLTACPSLPDDSILRIIGKQVVSETYITMTLKVLEKTGIKIQRLNEREFKIKGNQKFKGLKNFKVPSDYGLSAFLLAAAALVPSEVILEGIFNDEFIQADGQILAFLKSMGVRFSKTNRRIKIHGPFVLKGGEFSLKDSPDLVPIMAVLALFSEGQTRLYDIGHVRAKESDRISDLRNELLKIGADVVEKDNEIIINPKLEYKKDVVFDPHHDHRLAMSLAVLGLKLGAKIKDIECVSKSYPCFVKDLKRIKARIS